MGEQITTTKHLLETVTNIRKKYYEIAKLTGENFNLLRILGKEHYENYHSAIISDLLNEKGSHGQDDLFLRLFIDVIKVRIKNDNEKRNLFNEINHFSNSKAQTEKPTSDGRIDVFVSDSSQILIIENKIGASHQPEQLRRYYLDAKSKYNNKNYLLLFLWKFEVDFNDKEFNSTFGNERDSAIIKGKTISISYAHDIKNWIIECIKECANLPIIRETLNQYLNTINFMTGQSNNRKMSEEISKLLKIDVEKYKAALELTKVVTEMDENLYSEIFEELQNQFFEKFRPDLKRDNGVLFFEYKGYEFILKISNEGKAIGIWLFPVLNGKFGCVNDSDIMVFKQQFSLLENHFDKVYQNVNYTCYVYSKNDFLNYSSEQKFNLFNELNVSNLIEEILREVDLFTSIFKQNITQMGLDIDYKF